MGSVRPCLSAVVVVVVVTAFASPSLAADVCGETVPANRFIDGIPAYAQCAASMNAAIYSNDGIGTATMATDSTWVRTQRSGGYQCTELANRYLRFRFNVTSVPNGDAGVWCEAALPAGLQKVTAPVHGDLIVLAPGSCGADATTGHVAVVDTVAADTLMAVQQNGASRSRYNLTCAACFLHATANTGAPSPDGGAGDAGRPDAGSGGAGSGRRRVAAAARAPVAVRARGGAGQRWRGHRRRPGRQRRCERQRRRGHGRCGGCDRRRGNDGRRRHDRYWRRFRRHGRRRIGWMCGRRCGSPYSSVRASARRRLRSARPPSASPRLTARTPSARRRHRRRRGSGNALLPAYWMFADLKTQPLFMQNLQVEPMRKPLPVAPSSPFSCQFSQARLTELKSPLA